MPMGEKRLKNKETRPNPSVYFVDQTPHLDVPPPVISGKIDTNIGKNNPLGAGRAGWEELKRGICF